jgi:hypothetical protein
MKIQFTVQQSTKIFRMAGTKNSNVSNMVVKIDIIIHTRKANIINFVKNKIHFYVIIENLRIELPRQRDMIMVFRIVTMSQSKRPTV